LEGAAVQVAKPLTAVDDALARPRWILFAVTIGGVGLAAGFGVAVSPAAARPRGVARLGASGWRSSSTSRAGTAVASAPPRRPAASACGWRCLLSELLPASQRTFRLDEPHIRHDQITTDRRRGCARRLRRLR
jgi:hypothetical protein